MTPSWTSVHKVLTQMTSSNTPVHYLHQVRYAFQNLEVELQLQRQCMPPPPRRSRVRYETVTTVRNTESFYACILLASYSVRLEPGQAYQKDLQAYLHDPSTNQQRLWAAVEQWRQRLNEFVDQDYDCLLNPNAARGLLDAKKTLGSQFNHVLLLEVVKGLYPDLHVVVVRDVQDTQREYPLNTLFMLRSDWVNRNRQMDAYFQWLQPKSNTAAVRGERPTSGARSVR